MKDKRLPAVLAALLCAVSAAACGDIGSADPAMSGGEVEYSTEQALSAAEYTLFVSKQVTSVMGVLTSHASTGYSVTKGEYPLEDEIANCESSVKKVQECIDEVSVMRPAKDYEDARDATLEKMENALNTLESYQEELGAESPDFEKLSNLVDLMKGDFTTLAAQAGTYWR